jgi:hypothetical protein
MIQFADSPAVDELSSCTVTRVVLGPGLYQFTTHRSRSPIIKHTLCQKHSVMNSAHSDAISHAAQSSPPITNLKLSTSSLPPSRSYQSLLLSPVRIQTPIALKIPHTVHLSSGVTVEDPFYHLHQASKQRDAYLNAESRYHQQITQTYSQLSKTVDEEMKLIATGSEMKLGELANFWQMKEHIYWLEQGNSLKRCHEEGFDNKNVPEGRVGMSDIAFELLIECP